MTIAPDLHVGLPFLEGLCHDLRGKRKPAPQPKPVAPPKRLSYWQQTVQTSLAMVQNMLNNILPVFEMRTSL